jgi:hypothetical protein
MPRVQFNVAPQPELKAAYGYAVEVTKDGVFGEVPEELVASEAAAGRIKVPEAKKPEAKPQFKKDEE